MKRFKKNRIEFEIYHKVIIAWEFLRIPKNSWEYNECLYDSETIGQKQFNWDNRNLSRKGFLRNLDKVQTIGGHPFSHLFVNFWNERIFSDTIEIPGVVYYLFFFENSAPIQTNV